MVQASFFLGTAFWPRAHSCRSALPPTDNVRRVDRGFLRRFSGLEPHMDLGCAPNVRNFKWLTWRFTTKKLNEFLSVYPAKMTARKMNHDGSMTPCPPADLR